jgi:hypothetical protein
MKILLKLQMKKMMEKKIAMMMASDMEEKKNK